LIVAASLGKGKSFKSGFLYLQHFVLCYQELMGSKRLPVDCCLMVSFVHAYGDATMFVRLFML
jgi:hypothetical protein